MSLTTTVASRRPPWKAFPTGIRPVALGVACSGVCAYAFLALAARYLGPVRFAPLAAFWSFTFLVGPGCFSNLEKEAGRLISGGLASGEQRGAVLRQACMLGACLIAILVLLFVASSSYTLGRLFSGSWVLMLAFLVALVTICGQYLGLGVLAGNSRFGSYAVLTASEGAIRLCGAVALVVVGDRAVGSFAFVIAVAPALAVACVVRALSTASGRGINVGLAAMSRSTSWLLVSTFLAAVLVGSGPVTVQLLGGAHPSPLTGRFLSAVALVRVPLFLYTSASATLLPALAGHAAAGEGLLFRRLLNRLVVLVVILGGLSVVAAAWVGPAILQVVFGSAYRLPALDLTILAGAAAALMMATTLSAGLMARGEARVLALAWAIGVGVMVVVTALVTPLLERVELGLLAGSMTCAVAMFPPLFGHRRSTRRVRRPPPGVRL